MRIGSRTIAVYNHLAVQIKTNEGLLSLGCLRANALAGDCVSPKSSCRGMILAVAGRRMDTPDKDYVAELGKVIANLHSLEASIRIFLAAKDAGNGMEIDVCALSQDEIVPETFLSSYDSLGQVIRKYNELAAPDCQVDPTIVILRDSLAHGRVIGMDATTERLRLVKFGRRDVNGNVRVELAEDLTLDWLIEQRQRVYAEILKVGRSLGARVVHATTGGKPR